jgi:hypothetical protein
MLEKAFSVALGVLVVHAQTVNLSLPTALKQYVERQVKAGRVQPA